jgi:D-beta-D-heptose 7-phosphate kinase/D-beta-D-heptose 1-phosphate adenosyltransferase
MDRPPRVLTRQEAVTWVSAQRAASRRIVFTNGVFDLLHPGHVRYLTAARGFGDVLIVGVNSDRSARLLEKGADRPLNPAEERAEVLASLEAVDAVTIFDEPTPLAVVDALQPDVLVKGADWAPGTIVGADIVESRGGRVERVAVAPGYSTTALVARVRDGR